MKNSTIFKLTKLADDYEAKARKYREVIKDIMEVEGVSLKPRKHKGYKPGTHWTQKPENRKKLSAMLRHRASFRRTK